ncbi:MAG: hypothetical protein ABIT05_00340 [Chitinophagaceae bacterium]
MRKIFFILLVVVAGFQCKKDIKCPSGTDIGCGCYDTGNPTEPGTSNGWTPAYWDASRQDCYWVNTLGNFYSIDKKYCTCK